MHETSVVVKLYSTDMKRRRPILRLLIVLVVFTALFGSCSKDDEGSYKYFVSTEFAISYTTQNINTLLNTVSESYPELEQLKPFVETDVNVYKLIYKTEIGDKEIKASGLICLPAAEGEYPVLCFQNGTNTQNISAPSKFVVNPVYQMVEFVASMGYIVVMPDYPGFGESSSIPHPYLVKEPTVRSTIDMLYALNEIPGEKLDGVSILDEYYLIGYSQGGWATLALHQAMELDYNESFNLAGSACGAGPYNLNLLFSEMINADFYPMPVYLGYIINAYSAYGQFTNKTSDILQDPYAGMLSTLYDGTNSSEDINGQLTESIPDLLTEAFIEGFAASPDYSSVREALAENSITAWKTSKPLFLVHGENDTHVNPVTTENIYNSMILAGTSDQIITKEIVPDADHGEGVVPSMIKGLLFLMSL